MKKLLSAVIAILVAMSFSTAAFAADVAKPVVSDVSADAAKAKTESTGSIEKAKSDVKGAKTKAINDANGAKTKATNDADAAKAKAKTNVEAEKTVR